MRIVRRILTEYLKSVIESDKYIIVNGLRYTGKNLCVLDSIYKPSVVDLYNIKEMVEAGSKGAEFLSKYKGKIVIQHIEQAAGLLEYISCHKEKVVMLSNRDITGTEEYRKYIKDKAVNLTLYGFSIYELANVNMQKPFIPKERPECIISKKSISYTYKQIWKGFFPEICMEEDESLWHGTISRIIEDILHKEVLENISINNKIVFFNFLQQLMYYIGSELNITEIAEKIKAAPNTVKSWVYLLEDINFIYLLKPYNIKSSRRYIKAPKLYVTDTSLAAWLLSMENAKDIEESSMRDKFFENFVVMEIIKSYRYNGREEKFYHYRDNLKVSIDLLIESDDIIYPVNIRAVTLADESMVESFTKVKTNKKTGYGALICLTDMYKRLNDYASAISIWEI